MLAFACCVSCRYVFRARFPESGHSLQLRNQAGSERLQLGRKKPKALDCYGLHQRQLVRLLDIRDERELAKIANATSRNGRRTDSTRHSNRCWLRLRLVARVRRDRSTDRSEWRLSVEPPHIGREIVEDRLPSVPLHVDRTIRLGIEAGGDLDTAPRRNECRPAFPAIRHGHGDGFLGCDLVIDPLEIESHSAVSGLHARLHDAADPQVDLGARAVPGLRCEVPAGDIRWRGEGAPHGFERRSDGRVHGYFLRHAPTPPRRPKGSAPSRRSG